MTGKRNNGRGNRKKAAQAEAASSRTSTPGTSIPETSKAVRELLNPRAWVLVPRADYHFCHDASQFTGGFKAINPIVVWDNAKGPKPTLQDPTALVARGIGECTFRVRSSDGSTSGLKLQNVLYVPKLPVNIISSSVVLQKNKGFTIDYGKGIISAGGVEELSFSSNRLNTLNLAHTYDRLFREGVDESGIGPLSMPGMYVEDPPVAIGLFPGTSKAAAEEPEPRRPGPYAAEVEEFFKPFEPSPHAAKLEDEPKLPMASPLHYYREPADMSDEEFSPPSSEAGDSSIPKLDAEERAMYSLREGATAADRVEAIEDILFDAAHEPDGDRLAGLLDRKLTLTVGDFFKLAPEVCERLVGKVAPRPEERLREVYVAREFGSRMKFQNALGLGLDEKGLREGDQLLDNTLGIQPRFEEP